MKKYLIIAAAAALALTACQKVNKMDENLQDGFQEGFTGMEVRVPVSMDEGIQTKSFSFLAMTGLPLSSITTERPH